MEAFRNGLDKRLEVVTDVLFGVVFSGVVDVGFGLMIGEGGPALLSLPTPNRSPNTGDSEHPAKCSGSALMRA